MKRVLICTIVAAFTFGLSAAAHAAVILGEQKGTDNGGNKAENTFKWSHALKFSGEHDVEPFKFNYSFGSSQGNQGGQKSQNGQGDASEWSHSHAFKGTLEDPLQFSFGPPEDNQGGYQSRNGLLNAFEWLHSLALAGEQQEDPFNFNYQYGSLIDVEGNYMSMNGPEYAKRHGDVPDTTQQLYYYESYGLGSEMKTGGTIPECPHAAPEPVSILLMGLGGVWIAARH